MSETSGSGVLDEATLKKLRRREVMDRLAFWVAIFSLLATMHADVFEQEENRLAAVFISPFSRLVSYTSSPKLSSLLSVQPSDTSKEKEDAAPPLYIFMVDVSASMLEQEVSEQEVNQYLRDIQANRFKEAHSPVADCLVPEGRARGFGIARSELCRYIDAIPLNARAALWTFGYTARQVVPPEEGINSPRFRPIEEGEDGGNSRGEFFAAIRSLEANQNRSDFEGLLEKVSARYRDEIKSNREVHFILVSDFVHDIGGERDSESDLVGNVGSIEDSFWQSRYRMSLLTIGNRFREMSKYPGKTFHFAVIRGARRAICSVLPVAGEMVGRDAYRELRFESGNIGSQFDFLRAYDHVEEPIIFYFTQGNDKPRPLEIIVDDDKYEGAQLRLGLASSAAMAPTYPLEIQALLRKKEKVGGLVRIGESFSGQLGPNRDRITLQPESIIDSREAATYRLLLSWEGDGALGEESRHRTFAVRLVFKRQLSVYGAIAMVLALGFILYWGTRMIYWALPKRSPRRVRSPLRRPGDNPA